MARSSPPSNAVPSDELKLLIERWERLQEEKQSLAEDQKEVMSEAWSRGFDTKTIRRMIRLRKLTREQRREEEALDDIYKAALGMLDGTPLGNWAIDRLKKPEEKAEEQAPPREAPDANVGAAGPAEGEPADPVEPPEPELTVEDARRLGTETARSGASVTANPFPAFDERRAAWDEAWCAALGSDGMDIPDALKPTPKPKKADPKPDDAK
jgi:uncharacterized protein (UPF0335 family)